MKKPQYDPMHPVMQPEILARGQVDHAPGMILDCRGQSRLNLSPRCGARTRAGTPCRSPAVGGKARCRMHGGASGSGAPRGNRNAWKHGLRSAGTRAMARALRR